MVGKVSEIKNIGHRTFLLGKKRGFQVITLLYLLCLPLQNHPGATEQETTSHHEVTGERIGLCKHCPETCSAPETHQQSLPRAPTRQGTAALILCAQTVFEVSTTKLRPPGTESLAVSQLHLGLHQLNAALVLAERLRRVTRSLCITSSQAGVPTGAPISKGQHSSILCSSWVVGDVGKRVLQVLVSVKQSQAGTEQLHSPACLLLHLNYTNREPNTCEYSQQMLPLSHRRME